MNFIKLTLMAEEGKPTYVNMDLVAEMVPRNAGGTVLFFAAEGPEDQTKTTVKESVESILALI